MNIHTNVNFFLTLQAQLKIMHWQTKGYARHKALDETLGELNELVDTFIEEAMGKYGRFILENETKTIKISNLNELEIKSFCNTSIEALNQYNGQFEDIDTNLFNIRDEMVGLFNKLKYLLTLE
jgi:DNA-binding ferritin-like protein